MHIIIAGGGGIGAALAESLAPRHDVVVIDTNVERGERFSRLDVEFVPGSGTSPDAQKKAGAEHADLLIAATPLDEVNIVACSIAKRLGARKTICFVGKEDLVLSSGGAGDLRQHFEIGRIVWPEAHLAAAIERIIMAPGAIDAVTFADGRVQLLEVRLQDRSMLANRRIESLNLPSSVVIVAVRRDESISIPRGSFSLSAGDRVVFMGTRRGMAELRRHILPDAKSGPQRVTIIGGGDVGYRLAKDLDHVSGMQVTVIERGRKRGEWLAERLAHALILNGDGTDLGLLESEEIGRSDVLVSVIDNDERNLLASLLGRQLGVGKVITRVSKPANLRLFERVGIDVALSARGAAVSSVLHEIEGGRASLLAVLEEGQAKVVELAVPDEYPPTAIKDLGLPTESIVGTILRSDDAIVPSGQDKVMARDRLLVCCTESAVAQVRDMFVSSST